MRIAGATGGVGPAYSSRSSRRRWTPRSGAACRPASRGRSSTQTMAGTAELLRARGHDTLAIRRAVTSPGGTTARGLAALERGGVRAAFAQAMDDVVDSA